MSGTLPKKMENKKICVRNIFSMLCDFYQCSVKLYYIDVYFQVIDMKTLYLRLVDV